MTIRAMNWAWGINIDPAVKLVLLKIADRANDDGECWPGNASIAKDCCISERTLGRYLSKLEEMGLISVKRNFDNHGHRTSNSYLLDLSVSLDDKLSGGEGESLDDNLSLRDENPKRQPVQFLNDTVGVYISKEEPTVLTHSTHAQACARDPDPIVEDPVRLIDGRWVVDDAVVDRWVIAYQAGRTNEQTEDWIESELAKAALWLEANPRKRKKNLLRFLSGWLTRASQPPQRRITRTAPRTCH